MPCPFGVDIPGSFAYYNDAVNNKILPLPESGTADYAARRKQFVDGLRVALPDEATWATACQDCEECLPKCPQQIRIPNQMARLVELINKS
jgi:predicted aldo/keto reductase-like oxidoreductase